MDPGHSPGSRVSAQEDVPIFQIRGDSVPREVKAFVVLTNHLHVSHFSLQGVEITPTEFAVDMIIFVFIPHVLLVLDQVFPNRERLVAMLAEPRAIGERMSRIHDSFQREPEPF